MISRPDLAAAIYNDDAHLEPTEPRTEFTSLPRKLRAIPRDPSAS